MVDGVSDTEHDFTREVRTDRLHLAVTVTHAVGHCALALKNFARKASELIDQPFSRETCVRDRAFQLRIAAPLIIVDLARTDPFRQAEKVVQDVPIVGPQGRRKGTFEAAGVNLIAHAIQECASLPQNVFDREIQLRRHHFRAVPRIPGFAYGANTK